MLSPDVIIRRVSGALILSNPRTRTHIEINLPTLAAILKLADGADARGWATSLANVEGSDRTILSIARGLWSDHTGFSGEASAPVRGEALSKLLHRRWMIHEADRSDYDAFVAPLTSVLDRKHQGTFHERVGQYLALDLRLEDKWRWWHDQKFSPDGLTVNAGPYNVVQERFFDAYYGAKNMQGTRVLDFACGNGYYSNKFASLGASVVGIDTSAELVDIAKQNFGGRAAFHAPSTDEESLSIMNSLPAGTIDLIYMSDVMLILVEDAAKTPTALQALLAAFTRLLSEHGRIEMMEPNSQFWLSGFYGDPARPYVVIPEYRDRVFNVAPTIDNYVQTFSKSGFGLVQLLHPEIDASSERDKQIAGRPVDFPLWDFMTFVPLQG